MQAIPSSRVSNSFCKITNHGLPASFTATERGPISAILTVPTNFSHPIPPVLSKLQKMCLPKTQNPESWYRAGMVIENGKPHFYLLFILVRCMGLAPFKKEQKHIFSMYIYFLKTPIKVWLLSLVQSYYREHIGFHSVTEVKPCCVGVVVGWVTAWEYPML